MNKNKDKLKSGQPSTAQGDGKATILTNTDKPPNISRPDDKLASTKTPNLEETLAPHRRFQVKDKNSNHRSFIPSQVAKMDASRPDLDPPDFHGASKPIENESSSVQIITERKPSCWSITSPPKAPPTEWNSAGANIDRPASTGLPIYRMPKPEHNVERKTPFNSFNQQVEDKVPAAARVASRKDGHAPESLHHQFQQLQQDARLDAEQASQVKAIQEEVLGRTTQASSRVQLESDGLEACFPTQDPSHAKAHGVDETSITLPAVSSHATINHEPTPPVKQSGALPPHLKVQSLTSGPDKEHEPIPPHLRHPASPSIVTAMKATGLDEDLLPVKPASSTIPDDKRLPHLRGLSTTKTLAAENPVSVTTPVPTSQEKDEGYRPMIDIDAEIAVSQPVLDIDEEIVAGLRAEASGAIPVALPSDSTAQQTNEQVVFVPHNTRASSSRLQPSTAESKPKVVNKNAKSQFDRDGDRNQSTNKTPNGLTVGSSADALQDVSSKRRNANLVSPSKNGDGPNNAISSIKKGKKRAKEFEPVVLTSELANWDGKMIQPPVGDEWDRRQPFNPRGHERLSVIEAWREEHAADPEEENRLTINTASLDFQNGEGLAGGDVNVLSPIDKMHHETHAPNDDFTQARRHQNAAAAMKDYEAKIAAKPKRISSGIESMTKQEKRALRRALMEEERTRVDPPNPHAPAANIYIRPAEFKDMGQVKDIYNHYVREASFVHHLEPVDELYWRSRLQEAQNERNPFVVAIHMGEKFYRRQEDIIRKKQENVVGFTVAADYGGKDTLFHSTVELELMVDPKFHRQGIGRTLLDRVLGALSPDYHVLEGAPFLPHNDICHWIGGGSRQAKAIMVNILYSKDNEDSTIWRKQWLAEYEFQHVGTLPHVGFKAGKLQVMPMRFLKEEISLTFNQGEHVPTHAGHERRI